MNWSVLVYEDPGPLPPLGPRGGQQVTHLPPPPGPLPEGAQL